MNIRTSLTLFTMLFPLCLSGAEVKGLKTEHLVSPVGIDNPAPRFSWRLEDSRQGAAQTSYRIIVSSSRDFSGEAVWDSGAVSSPAVLATYGGKELSAFTKYWWKVVCCDKEGAEVTSEAAWFETGPMAVRDWKGQWISDSQDMDFLPAPRFRKEFSLRGGIVSASVHVACAGLYMLSINGAKVGDKVLDPAFTRYDRRILCSSYDVTEMVRSGANAIGVELGNGWYNHQAVTTWHFDRAPWRARPAVCIDLVVRYADGSEERLGTDASWKTSSEGPVTYNNLYTGERHDARKEQKGWDKPAFDDASWNAVIFRSCPAPIISEQAMTPIRESAEIEAVDIKAIRPTRLVYDFGVNMAGNAHLRLKGPAGTTVTLKYAERIDIDDRPDQSNIDVYYFGDKEKEPFQTDVFTLSGGDDFFAPKYSYKGFRYVEVNLSAPVAMGKENLTAVAVNSDVAEAGRLECASDVVEGIEAAARRAYLSNLMGFPTDCPQREKNGWTGDAHIAIETGLYNFDAFTVYEKWLADHRDEQQPNGVLPDIIPTCGWGYWNPAGNGNGLDWTSTIALIPWHLYVFYGDDKPLRDCYDNICRYVAYALTTCDGDGLTSWGRGDWVPVTRRSDKKLICSCFLYRDLVILSKAAALFGKDADAKEYGDLASRLRDAINSRYLNQTTGIYADGMQTDLSLPLVCGVAPEGCKAKIAAALAARVAADGFHINAGVHGTKAVLTALAENGYGDIAYRIASATDYPSWGWWLANGRTTLVENWKLDATRDISDNHIMFGDVAAWFYRSLGGINPDPEDPGFRHIILRPVFPKGLASFSCSHESPYGEIGSGWTRKGKKIQYSVTVPCSCRATLTLPDGSVKELESGSHSLLLK